MHNASLELFSSCRINDGNVAIQNYKEQIKLGITVAFWVIIGFAIASAVIGLFGIISAGFGLQVMMGFNVSGFSVLKTMNFKGKL